uniref:Reverse transcriptase domain-containing protein n=1 Tax=Branchiostoma floridae TaxID=7739 RepID=C3ZUM5_BRAFL|eukprot:XP_002587726.1 hypothetical protein BRAFLDRAFT_94629 [Branchiostoma floridae]
MSSKWAPVSHPVVLEAGNKSVQPGQVVTDSHEQSRPAHESDTSLVVHTHQAPAVAETAQPVTVSKENDSSPPPLEGDESAIDVEKDQEEEVFEDCSDSASAPPSPTHKEVQSKESLNDAVEAAINFDLGLSALGLSNSEPLSEMSAVPASKQSGMLNTPPCVVFDANVNNVDINVNGEDGMEVIGVFDVNVNNVDINVNREDDMEVSILKRSWPAPADESDDDEESPPFCVGTSIVSTIQGWTSVGAIRVWEVEEQLGWHRLSLTIVLLTHGGSNTLWINFLRGGNAARFSCDRQTALWGLLPHLPIPPAKMRIIAFLVCIVRHFVWRTRCDETFGDKTWTDNEIVVAIKQAVKSRLQIEHRRFGDELFLDMWGVGNSGKPPGRRHLLVSSRINHTEMVGLIPHVWLWLSGFIAKWFAVPGFSCDRQTALWGLLPHLPIPPAKMRIIAFLICIVRHFVWRTRCDETFGDETWTDNEIVVAIKQAVKSRLQIEHRRFGDELFLDMWGVGNSGKPPGRRHLLVSSRINHTEMVGLIPILATW